jgi:hypothetical protein
MYTGYVCAVSVAPHVCYADVEIPRWNIATAIIIIIEGRETALNGFWYQFTTGKLLKDLKQTINYHENGSSSRGW